MSIEKRNSVRVSGKGDVTVFFAHGFGCDQNMWRLLAPAYAQRYRTVSSISSAAAPPTCRRTTGQVQLAAGLRRRRAGDGRREFGDGPDVFVGHSVSAMIGMLADLKAAGAVRGPPHDRPVALLHQRRRLRRRLQPRRTSTSLLETLESNYLGWSSTMAPAIMGAPDQPELGVELTNSFCRTDPEIAKQFARVTFLSDNRADVPEAEDADADPAVQRRHHRAAGRRRVPAPDAAAQHAAASSTTSATARTSARPAPASAAIDAFLAKEGL